MAFERVPQEFMKNIFLSPHHFNDPENPTHGQYVHEQLRNDLYNDIVSKLVNCEFSILGTSEETMAIKRIEECRGNDPYLGLASKLKSYDGMESELICCEDWYVGLGK